MLSSQRCFDRLGLMDVWLLDTATLGGGDEARSKTCGPRSRAGRTGRDAFPGGYAAHKGWVLAKSIEGIGYSHKGIIGIRTESASPVALVITHGSYHRDTSSSE